MCFCVQMGIGRFLFFLKYCCILCHRPVEFKEHPSQSFYISAPLLSLQLTVPLGKCPALAASTVGYFPSSGCFSRLALPAPQKSTGCRVLQMPAVLKNFTESGTHCITVGSTNLTKCLFCIYSCVNMYLPPLLFVFNYLQHLIVSDHQRYVKTNTTSRKQRSF